MINLDNDIISLTKTTRKRIEKWLYIPDHPYRIIIIGSSGSGKTNALLNLIKEQDYHDVIDKIYLYARDLSKSKYQLLIKKREDAGIKNVNDPNAFIYVEIQWMMFIEDIDNYRPKRRKML